MNRVLVVCLALFLPAGGLARDFSKNFPLQLKSKFFEFHYQRQAWDVASFARFADGFVELVSRDFVAVDFDYPIQVLVLPNRSAFQQYLRTEFKERNPPNFGIYLPDLKLFATYEDSGWGTFAHEIMHPLVEHSLPGRPAWAVEAIPSFFEKFFGYWAGGALSVQWGYQNPWRIEALGGSLIRLDLEKLVAVREPRGGYDTSDLRMISVFLWQQGKFKRLLQLIASREHPGYSSYFEAAMQMPLKEVLPLWSKYLNDVVAHRTEHLKIPSSIILRDSDAFSVFMATNALPLLPQEPQSAKHL